MAAEIMTSQLWIDHTKLGLLQTRSKLFKQIDVALENYHKAKTQENRNKILQAIDAWIEWKGADWKKSKRNATRGIEILRHQAAGLPDGSVDVETLGLMAELPFFGLEARADLEARKFIQENRDAQLKQIFSGKTLKLKSARALSQGKALAEDVKNASEQVKKCGGSVQKVPVSPEETAKLAKEAAPHILNITTELKTYGIDITPLAHELIGAVTPFLGIATAGGKALKGWKDVAALQLQKKDLVGHEGAVLTGDPVAACKAVQEIVTFKRNNKAVDAALDTANFTAHVIAVTIPPAAVAGPATGAATFVGKLMNRIVYLRARAKECAQGNLHLKNTDITPEIFTECPVLGCYYLCACNHSDVVNLLVGDIGSFGWMDTVEVLMKKHVHPLLELCREFIDDENQVYELTPAVLYPNLATKKSSAAKLWEKIRGGRKNKPKNDNDD